MRRTVLTGVVTVLVVLGSVAARGDLLQDLGATFQQVAQELASAFPKVETHVVAVDGTEVRVEGPGVSGLRPGLELTAYRKGAVFRHPVTNQPLGQAEEALATLIVTEVSGDQATTSVVAGEESRTPAVGDGARITAGRLPVAVLPPVGVTSTFETADQTALLLVARFSAQLEKTGRFLAAEPRKVLDAATGPAGGPTPSAIELARTLGVPAVLTTRLVQDGRTRTLETAWISGRTGAVLWTERTPLARAVLAPRFAWETTPEIQRQYPVDGPVRGVAVADLDGDGRPEVVVADERRAQVYRWVDGRGPVAVPGAEFRPAGQILSVDAADVNGAGRAQLVVVDYQPEGAVLHATVIELVGEQLRTLYETQGHYLRIVRVGSEPWLLEQAAGRREVFEPSIRRLVWDGGGYRPGAVLRVPGGVTVYGLALMRLTGSPEPDIVALTSDDRLVAWTARGQRLWASADHYGGATVTFAYNVAGRDVAQAALIGRVQGRIITLPPDPAGPELLVVENVLPLGQVTSVLPGVAPLLFTRGRIHRLRWKEGAFQRVWASGATDGYIADFGYGDLDRDGAPDVVVGVVPRGLNLETLNPLGRPKAQLVLYELP